MKTTQAEHPITPELICNLLRDRKSHSTDSASSASVSDTYTRLMEIYCVVKVGGVAEQIEVARRLEVKEKAELQLEIQTLAEQMGAASRIQALEQEVRELEQFVAKRLQYLATIDPDEEAVVRSCLADIEAYFRGLGGEV